MNLQQRQADDLLQIAKTLTEQLIDQTSIGLLTDKERLNVIRKTAYQIETMLELLEEKTAEINKKPHQNEL